jgi:hypothetical protein
VSTHGVPKGKMYAHALFFGETASAAAGTAAFLMTAPVPEGSMTIDVIAITDRNDDRGTHELRVRLVDPDGILVPGAQKVFRTSLTNEQCLWARWTLTIEQPRAGKYSAALFIDNDVAGYAPLTLYHGEPPRTEWLA